MAVVWRGSSCRFVIRVPEDLVTTLGKQISETQKGLSPAIPMRRIKDLELQWRASKKEMFEQVRTASNGSNYISRLEIRQAARDAALRGVGHFPDPITTSGLGVGGIAPLSPTVGGLRSELDAIGTTSKTYADGWINDKGWVLAKEGYDFFLGCVRNALEDRIAYDLMKHLGHIDDRGGDLATQLMLHPARSPGEKSILNQNKIDDAEWNLGRRRLTLMQAIGEFKQRNDFDRLRYTTKMTFEDTFVVLTAKFGATREVHTIVPEDFSALGADLPKLPLYMKRKIKDGYKLEALTNENDEKIAKATVNRHISNIKQIWKWLAAQRLIKHDSTGELRTTKGEQKHPRQVLTSDDIKNIFILKAEEIHGGDMNSMNFWLPWIGLYTGARRGEIAQLTPNDIRMYAGVECFHIETLEDNGAISEKTIKTNASKRVVPVHSKLITLGLLDFRERARANENGKLFYELTWNRTHRWMGRVEKYLSRVLHPVMGGRESGKTFHSFRHTVNNRLLWKAEVDPGIVDALLGWSSEERKDVTAEIKKDLMRMHYGKATLAIDRLRDGIEKLVFPELD
ncbi:site-specific integrase [Paramagnetospirillum magneticum]|uniref:site-specific integrase n=1 Tax=Paramagnetospirillum magneticum TaxID=84159 RepID=UPI0002FA4B2D|nr:site-specific integrase [Paramagnetospirillum magneticum]